MIMNFGERVAIQDLGNHQAQQVVTLALQLAGDVEVQPDPKRKSFYEVEAGASVYYIHVSPVSGIIYLLAVWKNPGPISKYFEGYWACAVKPAAPRPEAKLGVISRA